MSLYRKGPGAGSRISQDGAPLPLTPLITLDADQRPGAADGILGDASKLAARCGITVDEFVEALRRRIATERDHDQKRREWWRKQGAQGDAVAKQWAVLWGGVESGLIGATTEAEAWRIFLDLNGGQEVGLPAPSKGLLVDGRRVELREVKP